MREAKNKQRYHVGAVLVSAQKGITLIALVITIIILLILAGVVMNVVIGENGIINKSKQAKEKHNEEKAKEEISLMLNADYKINREILGQELSDYLEEMKSENKIDEITYKDTTYTISYNGYFLDINAETLEVTDIRKTSISPIIKNIKITTDEQGQNAIQNEEPIYELALYINFEHSIENGTTVVDKNLPFKVTQNGTYTFSITGTVDGQTCTKTIDIVVDNFAQRDSSVVSFKSAHKICSGNVHYDNTDIDLSVAYSYLFDGITTKQGVYGALLMRSDASVTSYLIIEVSKKIKIYAYGSKYSDSAGSTGESVHVQKYNGSNYIPYNQYMTRATGERYLFAELEAGEYKLIPNANYVSFDEWQVYVVE